MSCKYCDYTGRCTIFNDWIENPGVTTLGICICEDDEDPSILCEDYEEI